MQIIKFLIIVADLFFIACTMNIMLTAEKKSIKVARFIFEYHLVFGHYGFDKLNIRKKVLYD